MDRSELKIIIENLLLASDQPVSADQLHQTFAQDAGKEELQSLLAELQEDYRSKNLQITEMAGGYQLCTRPEYAEWVRKFLKLDKSFKLSRAALDTLAIIAYKQPLTRNEVDEIRGVDSSGVVRTLLEKKIISPAGRKDVPGKPMMFRTTQKFLEYFGLRDLNELPTLEDFQEEIQGEAEPEQGELSFDLGGELPPPDTEPAPERTSEENLAGARDSE
ncbi:MAG: SMC-Scp complex subunit ScpB [Nitrospinaceae bacterium]|nr:SMC-Scp complex subunit ScpB [Nitrospinaceae bacterium]NIR56971.1 SMC-Scp complex subunit ScpB [Nitrospinaceae bacterium]NIS87428.1 SMC-Scp complex subunit ScpB [Nitrospinaceae bacterium]NIT84277.1 SMC-Scp complex subunit ScpB [Nitrospinaceae bacterium]NIU46467.1 SMC-Scp complex subunit ScpB [Nitrospinaceae bacterium]